MKRIISGSLFLALLIMAGIGYEMWVLPLWGWWPLPLFLLGWAFVVFAVFRMSRLPGKGEALFLSTASGVLLAAGFPNWFSFSPLLFIAFVPLLMLESSLFRQAGRLSRRALWWHTYHAFVVWNILSTWWVANSVLVPAFIAFFLNSFFMTIPWLLYHEMRRVTDRSWLRLSALAVFWLTFEYVHLRWEISWPWLTLGNGFARVPWLVQWYEYTGVFGGSAWIWAVNLLTFVYLYRQDYSIVPRLRHPGARLIAALLVIPAGVSVVMYLSYREEGNREASVVVVQPNYEPHYEKFDIPEEVQWEQFERLSRQKLGQGTDYLLFPETSFDRVNQAELGKSGISVLMRDLVAPYPALHLVAGIGAYRFLGAGEPSTRATRMTGRGRYEAYNAALQVSNDTTQIPVYLKSRFVPGAEMMPYPFLFGFLRPLFDKFGGSMEGYGFQAVRSVFYNHQKGVAVAPVICFESIYGAYLTEFVRMGAQAIFIMTNDGWWDNTPGHRQHLWMACLRAIETRRCVVRSANTGISGMISQRGDILQTLPYGVEGSLAGNIRLSDRQTFYVRHGDIAGRVAVVMAGVLLLFLLGGLFRNKMPVGGLTGRHENAVT